MKIRTGIEKLGKGMILLIFSIFTIFPFVWMILSALKTKAEIMDVSSFFPAEFQWHSISVLEITMVHMNLIIKGKHKKTLIFPVFSGNSVFYSDSCLVVV